MFNLNVKKAAISLKVDSIDFFLLSRQPPTGGTINHLCSRGYCSTTHREDDPCAGDRGEKPASPRPRSQSSYCCCYCCDGKCRFVSVSDSLFFFLFACPTWFDTIKIWFRPVLMSPVQVIWLICRRNSAKVLPREFLDPFTLPRTVLNSMLDHKYLTAALFDNFFFFWGFSWFSDVDDVVVRDNNEFRQYSLTYLLLHHPETLFFFHSACSLCHHSSYSDDDDDDILPIFIMFNLSLTLD